MVVTLISLIIVAVIVYIIRQTFVVDDATYVANIIRTEASPKSALRPLIPSEREALRQAEAALDWNTARIAIRKPKK